MTRTGRRALVLLTALVVVGGTGAAAWALTNGNGAAADTGTAPASSSGAPTPPAAPTSGSSTSSAPSAPTTSAGAAASTSASAQTGRQVGVVLGYADWDAADGVVEAAGFVIDVIENGGTCTLTLSSAGSTVSATATGAADATTTNCGRLTIPRAGLAAGSWRAVLTYQSPAAHGTSEAMTVEVPTR
jgi:hypothetical protein